MKKDIRNRKDIENLVNAFYEKVKTDEIIGYLFTDIAKVNWELHLPKMYDFWENVLFQSANYNGNPMVVHKNLHQKSTMNQAHFQQWRELWIILLKVYIHRLYYFDKWRLVYFVNFYAHFIQFRKFFLFFPLHL